MSSPINKERRNCITYQKVIFTSIRDFRNLGHRVLRKELGTFSAMLLKNWI